MQAYSVTELYPGRSAGIAQTVSQSDFHTYTGITGDFIPAHPKEIQAPKIYGNANIAHGMLLAGPMSAVLENNPEKDRVEPGTICLRQDGIILAEGIALLSPPKLAR